MGVMASGSIPRQASGRGHGRPRVPAHTIIVSARQWVKASEGLILAPERATKLRAALSVLAPLDWAQRRGYSMPRGGELRGGGAGMHIGLMVWEIGERGFFEQFAWAAKACIEGKISREACREWAMGNFSLERVAEMYEEHFSTILKVYTGRGFYEENPDRKDLDWLQRRYPAAGRTVSF